MTPPHAPTLNEADGFERAYAQVQELAATFATGSKHYLSPSYQEQEARQDFIDKFWMALGWDVLHHDQTNPYAQEVKVERGVTMSEGRKRADYAFYLGPDFKNPRFFVEAKKPSVDIANKDSYFQAVRYGWNAGTPLAVLTDFEQFHVLDCRARPDIETALARAVQTYHYSDYADRDKFGAIYWLFSRAAVAAGELDKYVATRMPKAPGKFLQRGLFHAGAQGIDESFLRELDEHRLTLARAFHAANPALDSETLTEATQRVLDRLVFLRFLEDKLIEPQPLVAHFGDKGSAWAGFLQASRQLDTVYNGNIFKPHLIDSDRFQAPGAVFGQICSDLSSEQSPYLFSLIPIHILGSIYERFLGKVIVVGDAGAKVEEKPEVRKAGGVYYTPDYIVRYIVDGTVGRQIEGKSPAEIAPLRFADIACGSGSFLLGVYDALLRYHTAYFNAKARGRTAEARTAGCAERDGVWHLSLWQKRAILLQNVWGVDIDAQAVEVAQMSLYLKLLEEETTATAHEQNTLHGAILPTLTQNIVFGNSLIGGDILQGQLFERTEERKLNAMDFKTAFPQIMRNGGFDAIVGNPPYIRIQTMQETLPASLAYYRDNYVAAAKGNYDIYVVFVERAVSLLKSGGLVGYILPHKFFNAQYGEALRGFLAEGQHLGMVVHFGDQQVFDNATTYTCLLFLSKDRTEHLRFIKVTDLKAWRKENIALEGHIPATVITKSEWNFSVGNAAALLDKLSETVHTLGSIAKRLYQGPITSADTVFLFKKLQEPTGSITRVFSQQLNDWVSLETDILKPVVRSGNIHRYFASASASVLFPYEVKEGKARLFSEEEMQNDYPFAWTYLLLHKKQLEGREAGKFTGKDWYRFGRTQNLGVWEQPKLMLPYMISRLSAYIDKADGYYFINVTTGGYGVIIEEKYGSLDYVCGLLNSQLLDFYLRHVSTNFRGGYMAANKQYIEQLPIRRIDFTDPADKARHDKMVNLVEQMLKAKKERAGALTDREIDYWQRRCDTLDGQIDGLVYELYGLTEEEIALVEGVGAAGAG